MGVATGLSFIHFVFPFQFDAGTLDQRVGVINEFKLESGSHRHLVWQPFQVEDDVLHPSFARLLQVETTGTAGTAPAEPATASQPAGPRPAAYLWRLNPQLARVYGLGDCAEWKLKLPGSSARTVDFRFGSAEPGVIAAQLALFAIGIGFLTIRVAACSDQLSDWLDLAYYFRFMLGQRGTGVSAQCAGADSAMAPFFPEPAAAGARTREHAGAPGRADDTCFGDVVASLLQAGAIAEHEDPWWHDAFVKGQLLPYSVLYIDGSLPEDEAVLLYRVQHTFHSRQELHPSRVDTDPNRTTIMPYVDGMWFLFSQAGGAFVAFDAPKTPFFRGHLSVLLARQYFLVFLLVHYQRFALMRLSEMVAGSWSDGPDTARDVDNERVFREIRARLLSFTARGYFTQVMQQENHQRVYQRWQEILQVERLFQEVTDEVRSMHDYLLMSSTERLRELAEAEQKATQAAREAQEDRARRLSQVVAGFGVFFGVSTLAVGFLGINLDAFTVPHGQGLAPWWVFLLGVLGAASVCTLVTVLLLMRFFLRPSRESGQPSSDVQVSAGVDAAGPSAEAVNQPIDSAVQSVEGVST